MRVLILLGLLCSATALAGSYPFTITHKVHESPYIQPTKVQWIDLDGDGDLDALASNTGTGGPGLGNLYWFENQQKGKRFIVRSIDDTLRYPSSVQAIDMDGDKDLDVVAVGKPGLNDKPLVKGGVYWFENVAGAKVWKSHVVDDGDKAAEWGAAAGDVDGDGDLDLIAYGYHKLVWYENADGKGLKWEPAVDVGKTGQPQHLVVLKYDGDEHLDFVTGGERDAPLTFWKGAGTGQFTPTELMDKKTAIHSLQHVDADGDKDLDLVVGADGAAYIGTRDGGDWSFDEVWKKNTQSIRVNVLDVDGDKDMDLIVRSRDRSLGVALVKRDGDAFGEPEQIEKTEELGVWLDVVDVDGDGDPDISVDKKNGYGFLWLENRSKKPGKKRKK